MILDYEDDTTRCQAGPPVRWSQPTPLPPLNPATAHEPIPGCGSTKPRAPASNPPKSVTLNLASSTPSGSATSTPPVVQIDGDNPAIIHIGDTYADLGATITAPEADKTLGIKTFLNGTLVSNIVLDTSQIATDTVQYVATDTTGVTATSTRTVIIDAVASITASVPNTSAASTSTATTTGQ